LEALADIASAGEDGAGVNRLAELALRDKSQVSRALRSLAAEGLVVRDDQTRRYKLGWRLYALGARAADARLLQQAAPVLRQLVAALGQGAHLAVEVANGALTVLSCVPAGFGSGAEGRTVPLVSTSLGRALLVDATVEELRARFSEADFAASGPNHRVRGVADLVREIDSVRAKGYALVDEDWAPGVVGASAPVRDLRERVVGVLNISAHRDGFVHNLEVAGELLARHAADLSRQLGSAAGSSVTSAATPS
jgi:IclR family KDG regulon transcriptional repressor